MIPITTVSSFFFDQKQKEWKYPNTIMTVSKLHKLLYYAQAWHVTITDKPLFFNDLYATVDGVWIKEVEDKYGKNKWSIIEEKTPVEATSKWDDVSYQICLSVWDIYKKYDHKQLEKLIQKENPWIKARKGLKMYECSKKCISLEMLKEYYIQFTKIK